MSYVCLLANRNGAVVAGDTRETIENLFHWDHRRKIYKSAKGDVVWAMCGLTRYFMVDYFRKISHLLEHRVDDMSDIQIVRTIATLMAKGTLWQNRLDLKKRRSSITVFICFDHSRGPAVYTVSAVNGRASFRRMPVPCALEGGSGTANVTRLDVRDIAFLSLPELYEAAVRQTQASIDEDRRKKETQKKYLSTVGGRVLAEKMTYKINKQIRNIQV